MRFIVTAQFLRSACELPRECVRDVLNALRLLLADPVEPSLRRERPSGGAEGIESIQAGKCCRLLFSGNEDVKLLFAGVEGAARQIARRPHVDATAYAEAPIAYQLRTDFWQNDSISASDGSSPATAGEDPPEPVP